MVLSKNKVIIIVLAAVLALLVLNAGAYAEECGGSVPCECGDTIVDDYKMKTDLFGCSNIGLKVESGSLDCDFYKISASRNSLNADVGILVKGDNVRVSNCIIDGFTDELFIDSGSSNTVVKNVISDVKARELLSGTPSGRVAGSVEFHESIQTSSNINKGIVLMFALGLLFTAFSVMRKDPVMI